ncbi:MAG: winged helix-turn-helix transcriptional regulator [Amylibacter sp.]|nr:winged helix-turn-helix transcriptional regulator [Amylibacter sp.]
MEMSHFSLLTHLGHVGETSPVKLARSFALTKGAITNTLKKLELAGYIHIRPDWDDARKKQVSISDAGRAARDQALTALVPEFEKITRALGDQKIKATLPVLREFRATLKS